MSANSTNRRSSKSNYPFSGPLANITQKDILKSGGIKHLAEVFNIPNYVSLSDHDILGLVIKHISQPPSKYDILLDVNTDLQSFLKGGKNHKSLLKICKDIYNNIDLDGNANVPIFFYNRIFEYSMEVLTFLCKLRGSSPSKSNFDRMIERIKSHLVKLSGNKDGRGAFMSNGGAELFVYDEIRAYLTICKTGKRMRALKKLLEQLKLVNSYRMKMILEDTRFTPNQNRLDLGEVETKDPRDFQGSRIIQNLDIPQNMNAVKPRMFKDVHSLKAVNFTYQVKVIGMSAFENCANLASATFNELSGTICRNAFKGCARLKSVIICGSNITIEEGAFEGCARLNSVVIRGTKVTMEEGALKKCRSLKFIFVNNYKIPAKEYF